MGARWIEKVNEGCSSLKYHLKQWMNALWEKNWVSFIHTIELLGFVVLLSQLSGSDF